MSLHLSKCHIFGNHVSLLIYKDILTFEAYLNVLLFSLAKIMCRFRCSGHKMPIEQGDFLGIDRNRRLCILCDSNQLGDEYHYNLVIMYATGKSVSH